MPSKGFTDSLWKLSNIGVTGIFRLLVTYALTRLLVPEDYGLFVLALTTKELSSKACLAPLL